MNEEIRKNEILDDELENVAGGARKSEWREVYCPKCISMHLVPGDTENCPSCGTKLDLGRWC